MLRAKKIQTLENVLESLDLVTAWLEAKAANNDFDLTDLERIRGGIVVLEHAAYQMECVVQAQK